MERCHSCSGFLGKKSAQLMTTVTYLPFYKDLKYYFILPVGVHLSGLIVGVEGDQQDEDGVDEVGGEVGHKPVKGDRVVHGQGPQELLLKGSSINSALFKLSRS